jgi:hypothetical protein
MLRAKPRIASLSVDLWLHPANIISPRTASANIAYATVSLLKSTSCAGYYRGFDAGRGAKITN